MSPDPSFGRAMRPAFALDPSAVFLNHGSFGAPPRVVLDAARAWRERVESQPVRFFERELPGLARARADALGRFIGARGADIGFVANATDGANAVLGALDLGPGDEIVATDHGYGAVRRAIEHVAGRVGAAVRIATIPVPVNGEDAVIDAVASVITDRAKCLVIDHITSPTALALPIARLIALARARGMVVLIDGAHAPGQIALDLAALDADFYVGNAHKWLFAPKGCAFLWARRDRQERLHPTVISHGYGQGLAAEFDWQGTRDYAPMLALDTALDFIAERGAASIAGHNRRLAAEACAMMCAAWNTVPSGPESMRAAMASIRLPERHPPTRESAWTIRDALWRDHRIEAPIFPFAGRLWLRISAQIYNSIEEYRLLAAALA